MFSADIREVILWQYNEAKKLNLLIDDKQNFYDENVEGYLNRWFLDVFNIDTATDFGLKVWSIILNVNFQEVPFQARTVNVFGFGIYNRNFYISNFGLQQKTDNKLSLDQKRLIIKLTYLKRFIHPTEESVKGFLVRIFGPGTTVKDNLDMTGGLITFTGYIPQKFLDIIREYNLIVKPLGVKYEATVRTGREFAFGKHRQNFFKSHFGSNSKFEI